MRRADLRPARVGRAAAVAVLCAGVAIGCSSDLGTGLAGDADRAPIQTDSRSYTVTSLSHSDAPILHLVYTNRTDASIRIPACQGSFHYRIERWNGWGWDREWGPIVPLCGGPDIVIEPGDTHTFGAPVLAGPLTVHRFGEAFRVVIAQAYGDPEGSGEISEDELLPVRDRVSNVFHVRARIEDDEG